MFRAMLGRTTPPAAPTTAAEAAGDDTGALETTPAGGPRPTVAAVSGVPTSPKRWAERFDTPEALETAFKDAEAARARSESERHRAQESAERLERLLIATLQAPGGARPVADQPQAPAVDLQHALAAVKREHELIALGDSQADLTRYVRAIVAAAQADPPARAALAELARTEAGAQHAAARQMESLQQAFFEQHPDLRSVRLDLLRQVAAESEQRIRQAHPGDYGSPGFMRSWFDDTAQQARAIFRLAAPEGQAASGTTAPTPTIPPRPRVSRPATVAAPFAESTAPRPAEPPALTGQAAHLARVFGRTDGTR
jgi:hypothetical protein